MMNYLDLFSGAGGFHLGLERVLERKGFQFNKVFFSEIDKYASNCYKKHFKEAIELGDIKSIRAEELGKIDLVTFGFPCQDLSIAGKRGGLEASRSSLFFEAMRIIRATKPKYFIFENVKGLFSSNNGADFDIVLREIANAGYDGQWQLLNTRWVLPQNRERVYFVGHLRGEPRPKVFPITRESCETIRVQREVKEIEVLDIKGNKKNNQTYASTLTGGGNSGGNHSDMDLIQVGNIDTKGHNSQWGRVYDPKDCASTINSEGGGMGAKTGLYIIEDFYPDREPRIYKDECPTLRSDRSGLKIASQGPEILIRRLTPLECERLQGFPDNWTEGFSDTQRYKMMGNAVTVDIVALIASKLFNSMRTNNL